MNEWIDIFTSKNSRDIYDVQKFFGRKQIACRLAYESGSVGLQVKMEDMAVAKLFLEQYFSTQAVDPTLNDILIYVLIAYEIVQLCIVIISIYAPDPFYPHWWQNPWTQTGIAISLGVAVALFMAARRAWKSKRQGT